MIICTRKLGDLKKIEIKNELNGGGTNQTTMNASNYSNMTREAWNHPNHSEIQGWTRSTHKRSENDKTQPNKTYFKYYSPTGKTFRSIKSVEKYIQDEKLKANNIIASVECANVTVEKTPGGGIHIRWTEFKDDKKSVSSLTEEEKDKFRNVWNNNLPIKWMVNSNPKRGKSRERFELYWNNGENDLEQAKKSGLKWCDALNDFKKKIITIDE